MITLYGFLSSERAKLIAISSAIFLFSCQEALDQHVTQTHFIESGGEEPQVDPKDVPYIHPMANSLVDGKLPFFEINEFPDGRAIAIGDEVIVSSDKEEFHLSGVVALETGFDHNPVEKALQDLNHEKISGGLAANLYGAGRLKMRYPVSSGLDGPSGWGSYETCIPHHQTRYHYLNNGNKISADVEPLKAVIFFYDKQHELGQQMDDLDFHLQYSADNTTWYTADSDVSIDEKSEVYFSDIFGGYYWRLKIYGYRVTSDDTGCGVNKIRAYYSWLYEESDRDDSDGPGTEIDTE